MIHRYSELSVKKGRKKILYAIISKRFLEDNPCILPCSKRINVQTIHVCHNGSNTVDCTALVTIGLYTGSEMAHAKVETVKKTVSSMPNATGVGSNMTNAITGGSNMTK